MSPWRAAGLNYVRYSNIAARTLRKCLQADKRVEAEKNSGETGQVIRWKDGQPIESKK